MTTEDLLEAFKQDRRSPVDVNFGQIALSPTIGRAGNYNVVQRGVVKDNALTELSRALAQAPQIAGQFKNIQEKAGALDVQTLDNEEIIRRVEQNDTEAKGFLKDWGKQRGYSRALYDQYYKTKKAPAIEALSSEIEELTPEELSEFLTSGGQVSAMSDDQMQSALEQKYRDVITPDGDIKLDDHMKVLFNESLRNAPILAARALGAVRKKQRQYIDQSTVNVLSDSLSDMPIAPFESAKTGEPPIGATGLPDETKPNNAPVAAKFAPLVLGKVTVYSPQKGGDKMEGGYPSSRKGPDGKRLVRSVFDVVNGASDYVTLAGSPEFYGRSYIIPSLPYTDPKTGEVKYIENVRGVVHDTGSAFKTAPEGRFDIPLGKDLDNKTMNQYNALLNKSNVRFVREFNQDGDPEDYKEPNEKPVKPLDATGQIQQGIEAHDIYIEHAATNIEQTLNQTLEAAKKQNSSFSDSDLEAKAVIALGNTLLTKISQGGDELAVVDRFKEMLEEGDIKLGDKPLFKTARGQKLYRDLDNAILAEERRIKAEGAEEDSTGDKRTEGYIATLATLLRDSTSTDKGKKEQKKTYLKGLDDLDNEVLVARGDGLIDRTNLIEVQGQIRRAREAIEGDFVHDSEPKFYQTVLDTYTLTDTISDSSTNNGMLNILRQSVDDPIKTFSRSIDDDETGTVKKYVLEGLNMIARPAADTAEYNFKKWLQSAYNANGLEATQLDPELTRDDLREKYQGFLEKAVLKEYRDREEDITQYVSEKQAEQTKATVDEIPAGMTPEQAEALQTEALAPTTTLNKEGKLELYRGLLHNGRVGPWLEKSIKTVTEEDSVEAMKNNNTPPEVLGFFQGTQDLYFKELDLSNITSNEVRAKTSSKLYEFTKKFGMPMDVITNGFFVKKKYRQLRMASHTRGTIQDVSYKHSEIFMNSNKRLATLDYATNGVYNLNAVQRAAQGNDEGLKVIYSKVFTTPTQKEAVPLEKFIQLQIELGQKQGRVKTTQSEQ